MYETRLRDRAAEAERLRAIETRLGHVRLTLVVIALTLGYLAYGMHLLSPGWIFLPVSIFTVVVIRNHLITEQRVKAERAERYYRDGMDRLAGRFAGAEGKRFLDPEHLYAGDLDLFGPQSLFQLLCRARTRTGEQTLASWLTTPATPDVIRARHAEIATFDTDRLEALAVIGDALEENLKSDPLRAWAEEPPAEIGPRWPLYLPVLSIGLCFWSWKVAAIAFVAQSIYARMQKKWVKTEGPSDLDLLIAGRGSNNVVWCENPRK